MSINKISRVKKIGSSAICTLLLIMCPGVGQSQSDSTHKATLESSDEPWSQGIDYEVLVPAVDARRHSAGKVQIVELFLYTSPLSNAVQPYFAKWLQGKTNIEYVRKPAICYPHARLQARMYFTLVELGRTDLHRQFFEWVFEKDHYPIYHTIRHPDVNGYRKLDLEFIKANSINENKFLAAYNSKEMDDRLINSEIETHDYGVRGTSTIIINGKYATSIQRLIHNPNDPDTVPPKEGFERFFRLLDYLVAWETDKKRPKATAPNTLLRSSPMQCAGCWRDYPK